MWHRSRRPDPHPVASIEPTGRSAQSTRLWAGPAILCLLVIQLGVCCKSLDRSLGGNVDFRAFYASGHLVATGRGAHLYDLDEQRAIQNTLISQSDRTLPFLYPAYAALPFAPLSLLPYRTAFLAFAIVNLGLLCITGLLLRSSIPLLRSCPGWLPCALALCFFPVSIALMQGQVSFLLLLLYSLSFIALRRDNEFLAGLLLAVTLVKFQLALPIAVLFLLWRKGRMVSGFACGAVLLAALSIAITGLHAAMQYPASLMKITADTMHDAHAAQQRYGMLAADMPNLHGLFAFTIHGQVTGQLVTLSVTILVIVWAARQRPSIAVALTASMLASYHMQAYDLTLLLLPLAIALGETQPATFRLSKTTATAVALLIVPVAPFLLVRGLSCLFVFSTAAILWASRSPLRMEADEVDSPFAIPDDIRQRINSPVLCHR